MSDDLINIALICIAAGSLTVVGWVLYLYITGKE